MVYELKRPEEVVAWREDKEVLKASQIIVPRGVAAVVRFSDGTEEVFGEGIQSIKTPSDVYGVAKKQLSALWGANIFWKKTDFSDETDFGCHGSFSYIIYAPKKLIKQFDSFPVTEKALGEKVREDVKASVRNEMTKCVNQGNRTRKRMETFMKEILENALKSSELDIRTDSYGVFVKEILLDGENPMKRNSDDLPIAEEAESIPSDNPKPPAEKEFCKLCGRKFEDDEKTCPICGCNR